MTGMIGPSSVRVLDVHAGYRCRHSGACCTAGWDIVAEPQTVAAVRTTPALGNLRTQGLRAGAAPDGESVPLLARRQNGHCRFYDPAAAGSCAIQREAGHAALPLACRHFPRVTLRDDRATFVTLSHYCPTAAAQLFDAGRTLAMVDAPDGFPADGEYVGLDARDALPPLLRPTALHSHDSYDAWLEFVLEAFDTSASPDGALARVEHAAEDLRNWTVAAGDLEVFTRVVLGRHEASATIPAAKVDLASSNAWWSLAVDAVPPGIVEPPTPGGSLRWTAACEAAWLDASRPICRYLGTHAFANWAAYQGRGIRTEVRRLRVALEVVRLEVARRAALDGRPDGRAVVEPAIRSADLLLHHLVDPVRLARALDALERLPLTPQGPARDQPPLRLQ